MFKKRDDDRAYGAELGAGIKQGMRGLNTVCSPKKRKTAALLILAPLVLFILLFGIGYSTNNSTASYAGIFFGLCLGAYQFYVGKIKAGILYTITFGGLVIGCVIDLLKLLFTGTFKDVNGFPLLY